MLEEIAWQTWRGEQLVEERFFYDPEADGRLTPQSSLAWTNNARSALVACTVSIAFPAAP